jgi:hypothetical protein
MVFRLIVMALVLFMTAGEAAALSVGAEAVENYSGCGCATGDLRYCNDQASRFITKMDVWHTRKYLYTNSDAWSGDLVEDQLGGQDNLYGDNVQVLLVSGHGGMNAAGTVYYGYLCKAQAYPSCSYNTTKTYLGEVAGQPYSAKPGKLRFLILCTCHGVDQSRAPNVWGRVFKRGKNFSYVMGYTGTSMDSVYTIDVGQLFAAKAAGPPKWTLKQSWFFAVEDAYVNDTGSLITFGKTQARAISRRDSMKLLTLPTGENPGWFAWSWHQG